VTDKQPSHVFVGRYVRPLLASLVLALGLFWVMRRGALPVLPPEGTLAGCSWTSAAFGVLLLTLSMQLRFVRYTFLISPIAQVPLRRIMTISWIAVGLITFLPFRLGEFARPAMLREKGRLSGWAVTGTVGAERIIDGVLFAIMLLLGLQFAVSRSPLPDRVGELNVNPAWVPRAAGGMALTFICAFLAMGLFYFARVPAQRLLRRSLGVAAPGITEKLIRVVDKGSEGLQFLTNPGATLPFLGISVIAIGLHVWGMEWIASAVGLAQIDFAEACVLTGVLGLAFALPNAPGFFGTVQLALYAALALYVSPEKVVSEGAALVFIYYLAYLGMVIGSFLLGLSLQAFGDGAPVTLDSPPSEFP
jgi:glycosyltransferase 2 family protein